MTGVAAMAPGFAPAPIATAPTDGTRILALAWLSGELYMNALGMS